MSKKRRTPLRTYCFRRLLEGIPVIIAVILINFTLIHAAPGDPATIMAGEFPPPDLVEKLREEFGLDRSLPEQMLVYFRNIFTGNLGYSYYYRQPVLSIIIERIPATLLLMGSQLIFASVVGIIIGVIVSRKPYSKTDNIASTIALAGYSFPVFWLGIMLMLIFSIYLGLFPTGGIMSIGVQMNPFERLFDILIHAALPVTVLGLYHTALIFRLTRSGMIEILRRDFIMTARVKGLSELTVIFKHALRNALLPIITVIGSSVGTMLAGAVMTETIFSWPGVGRLIYDSIYARDYPVIIGVFIVVSISVIVANIVTDMLYAYVDPRVRYK